MTPAEFYESLFVPCPLCSPYRAAVAKLAGATGRGESELLTLCTYAKEDAGPPMLRSSLHSLLLDCRHCDNREKVLTADGRRFLEELRTIAEDH